jgi:ribosome maturation factor RimP
MESIELVKTLIEELLKKEGFELYSLKYNHSKAGSTLEIIVDRDDSINLDDITNISNLVSNLLDEHDFSDDAYTLDVSSLGIEKPIKLEKLDKYVGKYVNIHLQNPFKGLNTLEGELEKCDGDDVVVAYKNKTRIIKANIKRSDIDKARLAIKF